MTQLDHDNQRTVILPRVPASGAAAPGASPPSVFGMRTADLGRRTGDRLVWLGGADLDILERTNDTAGRTRFAQMGLVLLSTAGLAVLSMSFALTDGLHVFPLLSLLGGLVWGFVILNLDRMLILNLDLRGGFWRATAVVAPRIFLAALLGVVISTPLVLRVFQTEIDAQIARNQTQAEQVFAEDFGTTAVSVELDEVRQQIAENEAVLRGELPPPNTPEIQSAQQRLTDARARHAVLLAETQAANRRWQCELYGTSCEDSSDRSGNGPLAQAREGEYNTALAASDAAEQEIQDAEVELASAREAAGTIGAGAAQDARAEAERVLPGLRERETELGEQRAGNLDGRTEDLAGDDGLLAQIVALDDLAENDGEAGLTHLAVGLLFFMIELMPVLVKIMTGLGAPSRYERSRERIESERFDDLTRSLRLETARKELDHEVESDMLDHERDMAMEANRIVADEMSGVMQAALGDWARDAVHTAGHPAAGPRADDPAATRNGGPVPDPGADASPSPGSTATVRSGFTLPSEDDL